ncbi:hypothetical protein [Novosphingobium pokkalii]|uniref:Uncharacterized protein n=2 Tax=Novosphingobium pokkalii TaxID=1770194 RepID=A0ABV7V044_9SPHN|nr:hypothetical protein [Novosphingobium pokkalii]
MLTATLHVLLTMPGYPMALAVDGAPALIGAGLLATPAGRLVRIYRQRRSAVQGAPIGAKAD